MEAHSASLSQSCMQRTDSRFVFHLFILHIVHSACLPAIVCNLILHIRCAFLPSAFLVCICLCPCVLFCHIDTIPRVQDPSHVPVSHHGESLPSGHPTRFTLHHKHGELRCFGYATPAQRNADPFTYELCAFAHGKRPLIATTRGLRVRWRHSWMPLALPITYIV